MERHLIACVTADELSRNPTGRTGFSGRGLLGRWGPNHAVDPIVTRYTSTSHSPQRLTIFSIIFLVKKNCRWATDAAGDFVLSGGKRVLEVVLITRSDNGKLAFPGGFVNPGETLSDTLKREFGEEALGSIDANDAERAIIKANIDKIFKSGQEVFRVRVAPVL
jgi:ADP-ribose pyrophosphatase